MNAILTCMQGDLLAQTDCDAIVNAANSGLTPGGGVCGRIHAAAGTELAGFCEKIGGVMVGDAVITPGFALSQKWIIHACGPRYGYDHPEAELLASAYRAALLVAERNAVNKIAFPAISTGIYGYPMREAARVAISSIRATLPQLKTVTEVRLVLYDVVAYMLFKEELDRE